MVTPPLDVEGGQVKAGGSWRLEELCGEDAVEELVHPEGIPVQQASDYRVSPETAFELRRVEESICEIERSNR